MFRVPLTLHSVKSGVLRNVRQTESVAVTLFIPHRLRFFKFEVFFGGFFQGGLFYAIARSRSVIFGLRNRVLGRGPAGHRTFSSPFLNKNKNKKQKNLTLSFLRIEAAGEFSKCTSLFMLSKDIMMHHGTLFLRWPDRRRRERQEKGSRDPKAWAGKKVWEPSQRIPLPS
ncbi:hypothetical protein ABW19_dt0200306 [Dactylella cylindrospora]|nr:hypothetical protein ABW19_dt0200306 [Dactylella cylindrospora]